MDPAGWNTNNADVSVRSPHYIYKLLTLPTILSTDDVSVLTHRIVHVSLCRPSPKVISGGVGEPRCETKAIVQGGDCDDEAQPQNITSVEIHV